MPMLDLLDKLLKSLDRGAVHGATRPKLIKYLSLLIRTNRRMNAVALNENKENLLKNINQCTDTIDINFELDNFRNYDMNDLKLIYTLIKYKSVTRNRQSKSQELIDSHHSYKYMFSTNTFKEIFKKFDMTNENNKRRSVIEHFEGSNESDQGINLQNYFIVLIENLKLIKKRLETNKNFNRQKSSVKSSKCIRIWITKVLDEIETVLFTILGGENIKSDLIYGINFIIEVIFEITRNQQIDMTINSFKSLICSTNGIYHSKIYHQFRISELQKIFIKSLNEAVYEFVTKANQSRYEYFFLKEIISSENSDSQIHSDIEIVEKHVPFFMNITEVSLLKRIACKTRLLKSIGELESNELNCETEKYSDTSLSFIGQENEVGGNLKKLKINGKMPFFATESGIELNINYLTEFENELNIKIQKNFTEPFENYMKFIKNIFTNERNDFMTSLVRKMSIYEENTGIKKSYCKRSVTFLLAETVQSSFQTNKFQNKVDCSVLDDANEFEKDLDILFNGSDEETDVDKLYVIIKPRYPFNLFIDRHIQQLLTKIFRFFIELKRVELMLSSLKNRLSRRKKAGEKIEIQKLVKIHRITNIIDKIYVFVKLNFEGWSIIPIENDSREKRKSINEFKQLIGTDIYEHAVSAGTVKVNSQIFSTAYENSKIKYFLKLLSSIEVFCQTGSDQHLLFGIREILDSGEEIWFINTLLEEYNS